MSQQNNRIQIVNFCDANIVHLLNNMAEAKLGVFYNDDIA